jgi:MerR family mercuric resistance operon transcriptional regulator
MTIGKLAKAAGVGVETVRFYERKGILRRPAKREGGFRHYAASEATRIRFVKRAQELGFTLREVKDLLELQSNRKMTGAKVKERAEQKIAEIRGKISDLHRMEEGLAELARRCGAGEQAIRECRVFDCFENQCK